MAVELFSGKYEIQGEIARGGMGVVYKAVHASLNRTVAIKLLHPQFAGDPDFLKRFQREARAMARLDHEHVIRVFDVGEEQGAPYIVMEYFEGKDLKRVMLDRGLFSPEEALAVTYQVADALAYAHARGIVHRDIKPGNIMLDARGKAKIADLGIAAAANEVSVTATGQIIGTPEYMSPEQARGGPLDGRSDLYSLGMVLYKMLTGKTLFEGISQMSIVGKLLHEGEEFVLSFPTEAPDSLQRLVGSLLKRRSEERVASAKALMGEIKGLGLNNIERHLQFEESDQIDAPGGTAAIEPTLAPTIATPTPPRPITEGSRSVPSGAPLPSDTFSPTPAVGAGSRSKLFVALIVGAFGVAALAGGGIYYLTTYPQYSNSPKPSTLPVEGLKQESISAVPDEIREIQAAIQVTREQVSRSRDGADSVDARRRASASYLEALDFEAKGLAALDKGKNLADQKEYNGAGENLREAKTLLSRAEEKFVLARTVAEGAIAREGAKSEKAETAKSEKAPDREAGTKTLKKNPAPQEEIETASGGGSGATPAEAPRRPPPQTGLTAPPRSSVVGSGTPPPQTAPNPPPGSVPPSDTNQYGSGLKGGKNWYDNLGSLEVPGKR